MSALGVAHIVHLLSYNMSANVLLLVDVLCCYLCCLQIQAACSSLVSAC